MRLPVTPIQWQRRARLRVLRVTRLQPLTLPATRFTPPPMRLPLSVTPATRPMLMSPKSVTGSINTCSNWERIYKELIQVLDHLREGFPAITLQRSVLSTRYFLLVLLPRPVDAVGEFGVCLLYTSDAA